MALKDLGEKGIVDPYPPLVDIKGESERMIFHHVEQGMFNS